MHIIAADIGGTKTRLAFANSAKPRKVLYEARYLSNDFDGFEPMLSSFIEESGAAANEVDVLTLALPGLVSESSARLTNLPWSIEKKSLKNTFGIKNVYFMNDFQASAFGTGELLKEDLIILNQGHDHSKALKKNTTTRVAVGAGTGLGVAWAEVAGSEAGCEIGDGSVNNESVSNGNSTLRTYDTEGGHIDFAPTNETQIELLQYLQRRFDHVSYERILSGDGLVSLYQFCAGKRSAEQCQNIDAEWVSNQSKNDKSADEALSLFVQIYGAYIGNIALLYKPFGGVYITGGVAAKIVNKMQSQDFMDSYRNKGRMRTLVEQIPVYLVTNDRIGVLGAMSEAIKLQQAANYKAANYQQAKK